MLYVFAGYWPGVTLYAVLCYGVGGTNVVCCDARLISSDVWLAVLCDCLFLNAVACFLLCSAVTLNQSEAAVSSLLSLYYPFCCFCCPALVL